MCEPTKRLPLYFKEVDGILTYVFKKFQAGRCPVIYCRNPKPERREKRKVCSKCSMRLWRANNGVLYVFQCLRRSAEKRGIEFLITYQEFLVWLQENPDYLKFKGRTKGSLHIDRRDNLIGYTFDNMRVLTVAQNVSKGNVERHYKPQDPEPDPY